MIAVNYTQFRNEMKRNMDLVTDEFETLIVARKENQNVVVIKADHVKTRQTGRLVVSNLTVFDYYA